MLQYCLLCSVLIMLGMTTSFVSLLYTYDCIGTWWLIVLCNPVHVNVFCFKQYSTTAYNCFATRHMSLDHGLTDLRKNHLIVIFFHGSRHLTKPSWGFVYGPDLLRSCVQLILPYIAGLPSEKLLPLCPQLVNSVLQGCLQSCDALCMRGPCNTKSQACNQPVR